MADLPGTPGTLTGLTMRIAQCVSAAGSITFMYTTGNFFTVTAFCFLIAAMCLQMIWSGGLAALDTYALIRAKVLNRPLMLSLFVVGDNVTAVLSLAAAASSGSVIVLYFNDMGKCQFEEECWRYQLSVALAFLGWFLVAISSWIMLWLLGTSE